MKQDKMPERQDIVTFFDKMTSILESTIEQINSTNIQVFLDLTKAVLAFIIAFNSRRPSEECHATLQNFKSLQTNSRSEDQVNEEVQCNNLSVFMVAATKNDSRVPILVPHIAQVAINSLLMHRSSFKIPGNLLFPKLDGTAFNGSHLLHTFKINMNLKNPKDFTANGLRHYWVTQTQTTPNSNHICRNFWDIVTKCTRSFTNYLTQTFI